MKRNAFLALRLGLLLLAAWALHRELALVSFAELMRAIRSYGWRHMSIALACTAASFATLAAIEMLSLRYVSLKRNVPSWLATITSFVAHAFGMSIGFSLLTGAAIRARAYEAYEVRTRDIAKMSAFVTLTVVLGLLAAGAVALLADPVGISISNRSFSPRPFGFLLTILVGAYFAWSAVGPNASHALERWGVSKPTLPLAAAQVSLSVFDWMLTGSVLFAFLPNEIGIAYFNFLRAYLVAQTVGMISHVPGGLGVFEAVLVAILFGAAPGPGAAAIVASLVMYRVVYYLAPLAISLCIAGFFELSRTKPMQRQAEPFAAAVVNNPRIASSHVE